MDMMKRLFERAQECPHLYRKGMDGESWDFCDVNDKLCLLMSALHCPYHDEIKEEWEQGTLAPEVKE